MSFLKPDFIFGRDAETQALRDKLTKGKAFLIHGPAGVGKTVLLRSVLPSYPNVLYCENSSTTQIVFRTVAREMLRRHNQRLVSACRDEDGIKTKSAVSLKGLVMDGLNQGKYCILLDHLRRPSYSLAAAVRELMGWGSTPVMAVARSCHMEDIGFLQPFYSDRSEKYEIRNFNPESAEEFAREIVKNLGLSAENMTEFLEKVLEFSSGNPGAILTLLEMGGFPKYRADQHIKITPLYIDFRMNWNAAAGH